MSISNATRKIAAGLALRQTMIAETFSLCFRRYTGLASVGPHRGKLVHSLQPVVLGLLSSNNIRSYFARSNPAG